MYRTFPIRSKRSSQEVYLLTPIPVDPLQERQFEMRMEEKGETTPTDQETVKHINFLCSQVFSWMSAVELDFQIGSTSCVFLPSVQLLVSPGQSWYNH